MAGGNCDAALSILVTHEHLDCGHWAHSHINDATSAGQEPCDDGLFHHLAGGAGIVAHDNSGGTDVGTEGLRKPGQERRCQRLADHSAYA